MSWVLNLRTTALHVMGRTTLLRPISQWELKETSLTHGVSRCSELP